MGLGSMDLAFDTSGFKFYGFQFVGLVLTEFSFEVKDGFLKSGSNWKRNN